MTDETQGLGRNEIIGVMVRAIKGAELEYNARNDTDCPFETPLEVHQAEAIRAALNAAGHVIRPKEPTPEMLAAGEEAAEDCRDWSRDTDGDYECTDFMEVVSHAYKAMIAVKG